MILTKKLRFSEHAGERRAYILDNLRKNHFSPGMYVITRAKAPNLFEIYSSMMLVNPGFDTENLEILGVGYGYQDTLRLVQEMVLEVCGEQDGQI